MRQKYLVKAGLNKYGRQLYLIGYVDDERGWDISAAPIPMSKRRCNEVIKNATTDLPKIRERFPTKYRDDISFEIVEYTDEYNRNVIIQD